jgi:hypothetical protein
MSVTRDTPPHQVSNPLLSEYLDQLDTIRRDARELAGGLTHRQLNWRPDERRWSVGQCLDHLTRTLRLYLGGIERMMEASRARKARGEKGFSDGILAGWLIRTMEPPPSLRIRTFGKAQPSPTLDPARVLAEFEAAHARLAELITSADGTSLVHARMPSPFVGIMRFTLRQAFAVNLAHARRHLWQARQVAVHPSFPGA